MPPTRATRAAFVLVMPLMLGAAGCSLAGRVRDVAGNMQTLTEMADALKKSSGHTYSAEYRTSAGSTVRLVQAPPRAAYAGPEGTYIASPDHTVLCRAGACQKAPPHAAAALTDNAKLSAVTGPGFVPPSFAISVLAAAALYPEATVTETTATIAGQHAQCAATTGLDRSTADADGPLEDFTICVTDDGVLASYEGGLPDGGRGTVTLTSHSRAVDASAFTPPSDASVADVGQLTPF